MASSPSLPAAADTQAHSSLKDDDSSAAIPQDEDEKLAANLADMSVHLKKNRLLGDAKYERFSLPASRIQSHEDMSAPLHSGSSTCNSHTKTSSGSAISTAHNSLHSEDTSEGDEGDYDDEEDDENDLEEDPEETHEQIKSEINKALEQSQQVEETGSRDLNRKDEEAHDYARDNHNVDQNALDQPSSASPPVSAFPSPDHDDPYARTNRPPQSVNVRNIPQRFVFSKKKLAELHSGRSKSKSPQRGGESPRSSFSSRHSPVSSLTSPQNQPNPSIAAGSVNHGGEKKKKSGLKLKRFFKPSLKKREGTPSSAGASGPPSRTGSSASLVQKLNNHINSNNVQFHESESSASISDMPFQEEGFKKYGKLGRVLGTGAGGSVRLMKRASDGTVFAVKEFRARHTNETQREYAKKVTAEFCIGSTLHHVNVIETLDIIQDGGRYFEVMEYCPYDFFAVVMSGKMSSAEIGCCFRQILAGVEYLHEMGLAHRDLKLDNCVVTEQGIIKLIDFGSATVFRYPFEAGIVKAHGVVGSDPYLAPEVLSSTRDYDPRPVDVWSIAIIFCCMTLRRFPWKAPNQTDTSFRLFTATPDVQDKSKNGQGPGSDIINILNQMEGKTVEGHGHGASHGPQSARDARLSNNDPTVGSAKTGPAPPSAAATARKPASQMKGPWRLLRLLPEGSRLVIGKMLLINPLKRATLEEVDADPWVSSLQMCTITKTGHWAKSTDHTHTIVPQEQAHLESYAK